MIHKPSHTRTHITNRNMIFFSVSIRTWLIKSPSNKYHYGKRKLCRFIFSTKLNCVVIIWCIIILPLGWLRDDHRHMKDDGRDLLSFWDNDFYWTILYRNIYTQLFLYYPACRRRPKIKLHSANMRMSFISISTETATYRLIKLGFGANKSEQNYQGQQTFDCCFVWNGERERETEWAKKKLYVRSELPLSTRWIAEYGNIYICSSLSRSLAHHEFDHKHTCMSSMLGTS